MDSTDYMRRWRKTENGKKASKRDLEDYHWKHSFYLAYVKDRGPCLHCGTEKDLALHHRLETHRSFIPARVGNRKISALLEEWSKCIVLCSSCHATFHTDYLGKVGRQQKRVKRTPIQIPK